MLRPKTLKTILAPDVSSSWSQQWLKLSLIWFLWVDINYGKVAHLELLSHQISELNNRLSVRNTISQISQRLSLINQRCRRILYHQMCFHVFLYPCCLWMLINAILGFDLHSHAHTFSLSASLLPCFISLWIKGAALPQSGSIELHISSDSVLIISKVALIRNWCHRIGMKSLC